MPDPSAVDAFRHSLAGRVVLPDDADYDEVRQVWNGMVDRRPAMIARCEDTDDVVACVNFARAESLPVSIRCGGHSVAGKAVCDDGLMIDLSLMDAASVDPEAKTARIQGGAQLGKLDAACQEHGLATTAGIVSETGVGGLTLGGGVGYLCRRFGLACDNLIGAEVVTAGGEIIRADENENADLFWALRGGGGNFGVVTEFEFQLHRVGPEVLVGQAFYPIADTAKALRFYRDLTLRAPDELYALAIALNVPPADPFPADLQGKPAFAIIACYSADLAEGRKVLAPLASFGEPFLRFVEPMPYTALQQSFNAGVPHGARYYWKSGFQRELSDEAIDTFAAHAPSLTGALSLAGFESLGGAVNRVAPHATAFPHRDAEFQLGIWTGWLQPSDDDKVISWARQVHSAMSPYLSGGVYSNYLDQDDDEQVGAAFAGNMERLRQVKVKYDPDNFFRVNANVSPSAVAGSS